MYNKAYHPNQISNLSFLVTGGAGFIGSNLISKIVSLSEETDISEQFS
jgi:UDP-N-acetylglucosamine 4-epimerase